MRSDQTGTTDVGLLARLTRAHPDRVTYVHEFPARTGVCVPWPDWAPADAVAAWGRRGIAQPWRHQVAAAEHAHDRRHVVVSTGTASGKSIAFTLPALTAISRDVTTGRGPTALYIAPTKALASDQERKLRDLSLAWLRTAVYDGDAPPTERSWARQHANYVLTNPDMLHHSLLPGHRSWSTFLRRLDLIVVDEVHAYRGVFGAHVAAILRRLRRIAEHYGSDPVVVLASATTADPATTAARLIGDEVEVVADDCAACPPTSLAFWQPLPDRDGRSHSLRESAEILADIARSGRQVIAFARSRRAVEVLAEQARSALADEPEMASAVAAYRGGYLPHERRDLESALRSGTIRALASTSALELGIDVDGIDAAVVVGWPGTRAALWQRLGRAGRGRAPAFGVFVAGEDPLDTYLVRHPDAVIGAPLEAQVFDPANPHLLAPHLAAAAAELPLTPGDAPRWFGPTALSLLDDLTRDGLLRRRPTGWFWTRPERASDLADLRGCGSPVRIVESGTGRVLGTVDTARAPATVHPGAVYTHQGIDHVVTDLDLDDAVAWAHIADVDYSTSARSTSELRIASVDESSAGGCLNVGTVDVTSRVVAFTRRYADGRDATDSPLTMPPQSLRTRAVWWTLDDADLSAIDPTDLAGAAHAAEHAAIGLLPLFATCDRGDLGGVSTIRHQDTGLLTVFVYDGLPGGAGFAERGYHIAGDWLRATREHIRTCPCRSGCPACIHSPKCGNGNEPLAKTPAVHLLDAILSRLEGRHER